jgi:formylglycine-generating enzyme required for sulfatase activity
LKPKDVFKECANCPEMVVAPRGSFTMGSPEDEPGRVERDKDESPQHVVKIDKPFGVERVHVTVDQFAAFVAETHFDAGLKCYIRDGAKWAEKEGGSWRDPGFAQEGSHPAVCLSWNDAKAYVEWLARKTGKAYRLLTEAEWEYAARARTAPGRYPRFWFGTDDKDLCRYGADQKALDTTEWAKGVTVAPCNDGYAYTSPGRRFAANDFGLHDMFGDAWQWTADCYHDSYKDAPSDGSAWTTGDCSRRFVRGCSWFGNTSVLRAANRGWRITESRYNNVGFRVGRTLTP